MEGGAASKGGPLEVLLGTPSRVPPFLERGLERKKKVRQWVGMHID